LIQSGAVLDLLNYRNWGGNTGRRRVFLKGYRMAENRETGDVSTKKERIRAITLRMRGGQG